MTNACNQATILSFSSSPLQPIEEEVKPSPQYSLCNTVLQYSSATQFCNTILKQSFHMQVEGEVIEEHISDKETAYQWCISARSCKSLSNQSHLGKLFERSAFMVVFVRDLTLLMQ
jgi:hypothetical protein